MIVEEHLYASKSCPFMPKACEGPGCMAWRQEMRMVSKEDFSHPLDTQFEATGNGYCGLVYKSPR